MHTLARPAHHVVEVKRSQFAVYAAHVPTLEAAMFVIANHSDPAATHNCWAYRIGQHYRFSDDGEPGGTAGRPILAAIDGQSMDRVVVLVTRHFGGTKLGAGGLVRAYGGAAAECLRCADQITIIQTLMVHISSAFSHVSRIHYLLDSHGGHKRDERYTDLGVELVVELPESERAALVADLADLSRGSIVCREHGL